MRNFPQHLSTFFEIYKQEDIIELYNEFSVYFRLGNHLEQLFNMDYKIQFMREPEFFDMPRQELIKESLDIAIFDDDMDVLHAIEVIYIKDEPQLEKMFEICTGLRFMEQLTEQGWRESYVLLIADLPLRENDKPHYLFDGETIIDGTMQHPHGITVIELTGSYTINWVEVDEHMHYAVVPVF